MQGTILAPLWRAIRVVSERLIDLAKAAHARRLIQRIEDEIELGRP
jgi:hypothetical protein